ncbi:putative MFS family arabinose efflux permease [Actinoallomurus bryophytorum]|uniref:Putative MFS family arabinose efflux permease n=2 Tax=Actinoallomurus bryophytorum TaxID=1490222 RepID=A0A543C1E3_9ACTN|nr:putative MFS family arabinose efflux permease [Actinoallomurus bryophytorum]
MSRADVGRNRPGECPRASRPTDRRPSHVPSAGSLSLPATETFLSVMTAAAPVTQRRSATLAVLSLAQFLIALDYSIIYIALPSIAGDLGLAPALAQWVISAYAVLFAGFLVVGGRLSDRVGAARLFIGAIIMFGVASAVGGAAQDGTVLLAARAAQGLGAALLQPAVLGLIGTTFPAGPERSRALAVWGSVGASGLAAGAILGGLLTTASWRLTFYVNVPLTLLCALGAAVWVGPAREHVPAGRIPMLASVLGTGTVLTLVLGLTLGSDRGWAAAPTVVCLGSALALFAGFVRNERVSGNVLIEHVLRRTRSLRSGALATALYMASVGSEFYLLTLLLQSMKGYTPFEAGLAFLPLAVMVTAGGTTAGRAVRRLGAGTALVTGFAIATAGLLWLAVTLHGDSYAADLLPGLVLSGFGHGIIYTSMFIIGTHDVPSAHQSTAGALLTTSQYLSGAVTVAVLTLTLGPSPDYASFRIAFLLTTGAATAGLVLAASRRH